MSAAAVLADVTEQEHAVLTMAAEVPWPRENRAFSAVASAHLYLARALIKFERHPVAANAARAARAADRLILAMDEHCGPGWGLAR